MLLTILAQNNLQQTQAGLGVTTRAPLFFSPWNKKWPNPDPQTIIPDLIAIGVLSTDYPAPTPRKYPAADAPQAPITDLTAALAQALDDYSPTGLPARPGLASDAPFYNLALLTPIVVAQPQPQIDYPALPQKARGPDLDFPNIASLSITPPPPAGPTPAGRHHKRFKVFLEGRAVYFATRAEAEAARDRYRDGLILEARAVGVHKIKVRRPRITQVTTDGRHPPDLAPAKQMARAPLTSESEILRAIKEGKMREEEEIAIALLLS